VTQPSTDDERTVRPFAAILQEVAAGKLHTQLSEKLNELTEAVKATGKKGTVTVQITVEPVKKGNTNALTVSGKTVAKIPEGDDANPSSVFFTDAAGNLTRNDPAQIQLPLRGLETPKVVNQ
jgi:antitoxin (DNA-binding transcriptional repressor) of toxin-antitoxin stability system